MHVSEQDSTLARILHLTIANATQTLKTGPASSIKHSWMPGTKYSVSFSSRIGHLAMSNNKRRPLN